MTKTKNNSSVSKATKDSEVIYLSSRDEQHSMDITLDMQGYTIETL